MPVHPTLQLIENRASINHFDDGHQLDDAPMTGFDTEGVRRAFGLSPDEMPVMLLAVGKADRGNAPQKPRRPVSEVLDLA